MAEKKPYLRIKNWEMYQGYKMKGDKTPPRYVQLHATLFTDPDFFNMTSDEKVVLLAAFVEMARVGNGKLPNNLDILCEILQVPAELVRENFHASVERGWCVPCTEEEAAEIKAAVNDTKPGPKTAESPLTPREFPKEIRDAVNKVVLLWRDLGIKPEIRGKVRPGTKRHDYLVARIKEYSEDEVLEMVRKRAASRFLSDPPRSGKFSGVVFNLEWCCRPNNFPKILEGNYDNKGPPQSKINFGEHSGSDILWAGQCARRRGLNDDRMDREQLFEIYNQDIGTCQMKARETGLDTTGMTPNDLFRWFHSETGKWPHEANEPDGGPR